MRSGAAVDISREGLQIRTSQPEVVGAYVHIELMPRRGHDAAQTVMVRGQVVRVKPLKGGEFAMGVRMHTPPLQGRPMRPGLLRNTDAARSEVTRMAALLREYDPSHAQREEEENLQPVPVQFISEEATREKRRRGYAWMSALLLLLLLAVLLLWPWEETLGDTAPLHGDGLLAKARSVLPDLKPPPQAIASAQDRETASEEKKTPPDFEPLFASGADPETPGAMLPDVQPLRSVDATPRAGAGGLSDEKGGRIAAVITDGRGAIWPITADSVSPSGSTSSASTKGTSSLTGMGGPAPGEHGVGAGGEDNTSGSHNVSDIVLEVSKSAFQLTVRINGRPAKTYPVGLGKMGTTPTGDFRIANKISDPDWYNRGNVVPAGDPNNPLGGQWMGLEGQGGRMPYGLHPTPETNSIGETMSRGCIRMRPEDAESLFRLCPVGTPVRIRP